MKTKLIIRHEQSQAIRAERIGLLYDQATPDLIERFQRRGWIIDEKDVVHASKQAINLAQLARVRSQRHLLILLYLAAGFPREFSGRGAIDIRSILLDDRASEHERFATTCQFDLLNWVFDDTFHVESPPLGSREITEEPT